MEINIRRVGIHTLEIPQQAKPLDAGFDLRAERAGMILPGRCGIVKTGFAWELPSSAVGFVCSRSGLAASKQVFVLNAPGVVDASFRGEVCVILMNAGEHAFHFNVGDRIAQFLILPCHINTAPISLVEVAELSETERGDGGIGSTGVK